MEKKLIELHNQILSSYKHIFTWLELTQDIIDVFMDTPRHNYVDEYIEIGEQNETVKIGSLPSSKQLDRIYLDEYLVTKLSQDGEVLSSLSQPSLVLYMLNLAKIQLDDHVLEIGTGSGWNTVLMSKLIGEGGFIDTLEIDEDLSHKADTKFKIQNIDNIKVHCTDDLGTSLGKKYDLIFFTVGVYDLPEKYFSMLNENGRIILILKNPHCEDVLYCLKEKNGSFYAEEGIPCGFVQLKGRYCFKESKTTKFHEDSNLEQLLNNYKIETEKFWLGGNKVGSFDYRAAALMGFISLHDNYFILIEDKINNSYFKAFGIYNKDEYSLSLMFDETLVSYGSNWSKNRLIKDIHDWVSFGMPTLSSFSLEIRKRHSKRIRKKNEYLISRDECCFYYLIGSKFN